MQIGALRESALRESANDGYAAVIGRIEKAQLALYLWISVWFVPMSELAQLNSTARLKKHAQHNLIVLAARAPHDRSSLSRPPGGPALA